MSVFLSWGYNMMAVAVAVVGVCGWLSPSESVQQEVYIFIVSLLIHSRRNDKLKRLLAAAGLTWNLTGIIVWVGGSSFHVSTLVVFEPNIILRDFVIVLFIYPFQTLLSPCSFYTIIFAHIFTSSLGLYCVLLLARRFFNVRVFILFLGRQFPLRLSSATLPSPTPALVVLVMDIITMIVSGCGCNRLGRCVWWPWEQWRWLWLLLWWLLW